MKKLLLLAAVVGCSPATTVPMVRCIQPRTAEVLEVPHDTNMVDVREPRDYLVLKSQPSC